jgi:hypothetical protein
VSRPIRGLLVCTGEDVPEHSASAMARSLVIPVPQRENGDNTASQAPCRALLAHSLSVEGLGRDF